MSLSDLIDESYRGTHWRQGRKVGRTIYWQRGDEPSDTDPLIGVMDSPTLAEIVVTAVNERLSILAL